MPKGKISKQKDISALIQCDRIYILQDLSGKKNICRCSKTESIYTRIIYFALFEFYKKKRIWPFNYY